MLIDAVSATESNDESGRAIASFLSFIERKLGVLVVRDGRSFDPSLAAPLHLAKLLQDKGIIKSFYKNIQLSDEPRMQSWSAICNNRTSHQTGGASWDSEEQALYAALAEALERYIWFMKEDYYVDPTRATVEGISAKGIFVPPERFSGYSDEQRELNKRRHITKDAEFVWIQGLSLVQNMPIYVPSQVVSGVWSEYYTPGTPEPAIRPPITIGLATWPTQAGARCAGANEAIEREAYMVMWLNQMTMQRYSHASLRAFDPKLGRLIDACEKYRLKIHVIQMPTDAPTHAIAVVLEDLSDVAPRYTIGIRTHRSLINAVEKAAAEAFRARRGHRYWIRQGNAWDPATPARDVGHRDRLYYWGCPENAPRLKFLIEGPEIAAKPAAWEADTSDEHLERIVRWCTESNLECIAVSLGTSPTNPTPLHIEMMIMPDLQWTYLSETTQVFGGTRWREIPTKLGYAPRTEPFADEPHPFS